MSRRVFIVDDDRDVGEVLSLLLEEHGFQVSLFYDPLVALEALSGAKVPPALLISDFQMPGINGLELIQRSKKVFPGLKTISISGALTTQDLQHYNIQPDAVLRKPFRATELVKVMGDLLGN